MKTKPETHIMIDFETMGTDVRTCPIVEFALVKFDINTGEIIDQDYQTGFSPGENLWHGRKMEKETDNWWLSRSKKYVKNFEENNRSTEGLLHIIESLSFYLNKNTVLWSFGATFDIQIAKFLLLNFNCDYPVNFRNERCLRTLVSLFPGYLDTFEYQGQKHNALDDCLNQVRMCVDLNNRIKNALNFKQVI